MSTAGFSYEVDDKPVLDMIAHVEKVIAPSSMQEFLRGEVRPYFRMRTGRRFMEHGDDVTGQWAPLEVSTMMIRLRAGYPAVPTNIRSGSMAAFLLLKEEYRVTPTMSEVSIPGPAGKMAPRLRVAQKGGQAPGASKPTPARPVLGMNARDLAAVSTSLEIYLRTRLG